MKTCIRFITLIYEVSPPDNSMSRMRSWECSTPVRSSEKTRKTEIGFVDFYSKIYLRSKTSPWGGSGAGYVFFRLILPHKAIDLPENKQHSYLTLNMCESLSECYSKQFNQHLPCLHESSQLSSLSPIIIWLAISYSYQLIGYNDTTVLQGLCVCVCVCV